MHYCLFYIEIIDICSLNDKFALSAFEPVRHGAGQEPLHEGLPSLVILLCPTGRGSDHPAVDEEVDAGLSSVVPAAGEEVDVFPLDGELR